jgi:cation transport regulator ChaC
LNVDQQSTDDSDQAQGPACENSQLLLPHTLCYIASSDTTRNTNYLGPASHEELVQQIARSKGPSGPNSEYLLKLASAMREVGLHNNTTTQPLQASGAAAWL